MHKRLVNFSGGVGNCCNEYNKVDSFWFASVSVDFGVYAGAKIAGKDYKKSGNYGKGKRNTGAKYRDKKNGRYASDPYKNDDGSPF